MGNRFSSGKYSIAQCDICGFRFKLKQLKYEVVKTKPHAAFMVDDLDAALAGKDVVIPPFDATEDLRVAFLADGDALIEVMQRI